MKDKDIKNILIHAPNWFGDAVMATPFIRCVKKRFPDTKITVIAKRGVCQLLWGLSYIDEFVPLDETLSSQVGAMVKLRRGNFELAFILPHSFRSALITFCSGAQNRTGYACNGRKFLLNHYVFFPRDEEGKRKVVYMVDEYFALGKLWGIEDDGMGPELAVDKAEEEKWTEKISVLKNTSPLIGMAPGAAFGPSKRWFIERYAEVGNWIIERYKVFPILLTGPAELELKRQFSALCHSFIDPFDDFSSVERLKVVIKSLDLLICNDSGPRHIATAFGIPTLTIVGPTALDYSLGPYEKGVILRAKVDCAPCQLPECPIDHRCMKTITFEKVAEKVEQLIENKDKTKEKGVEICDIIYN